MKIEIHNATRLSVLLLASMMFTACNTVGMPDLVDLPEFSEAIDGSDKLDYPNPGDAPVAPTDVRSAAEWDNAANAIIRKRDSFEAPAIVGDVQSDQEIEQNIDALKAKVQEYKLDDPVEY